jgi:hypothetical protein
MNFRAVASLTLAAIASLIVTTSGWADEERDVANDTTKAASSEFDPWGAPHLRWPDPLASHLGYEETYYHWTRDDRWSLLAEPTEARPLSVWVGGDSLAGGASLGFRVLVRNEDRWIFTEDVKKSTGVVSDWYFDWVDYLRDEIADGPYDVVVLSIGGNDWQGFRNGPLEKGGAAWVEKYQSRITEMLAVLDRPGRLVIWIGLPHFQMPFMVPLPEAVNPISRRVFENGHRSDWVDAASIVSPDGVWAKHISGDDGTKIEVRTDDGTHYQSNGARLITGAVVSVIERRAG